jgi:hypothetical protein
MNTKSHFLTTFGPQSSQAKDDELSLRIKALKGCIREIEQKQEHLLERIDSRIATKPKYEYEQERARITGKHSYVQHNYTKKNDKVKKKYTNPYEKRGKHEFSIKRSPANEDRNRRDAEIPVDKDQRMYTEPAERIDSLEDNYDKTPQFSQTKDFTNAHKESDKTYQRFENKYLTNHASKFNYSDANIDISDESPEPSIPKKYESIQHRTVDVDNQIEARNNNVINSRKNRERRISMTSRSFGSDSGLSNSNSKNLFGSSNNPYDKYQMVNDSFGSPDTRIVKPRRKSRLAIETDENEQENEYEITFDNDHIIKGLERQERDIGRFIPPSRIEPVPINLEQCDLSIAYQSSPNMISYQYEDNASPPKCKKLRQKLFDSPVHKKEEKQDTHPNYNYNPDNFAAIRAKDLHCGRGSSPLRTKFKTPKSKNSPRSISRSSSPIKKSTHKIEYVLENGAINIKTNTNTDTDLARFEGSNSPKDNLINYLNHTNSSLKNFQRKSKVLLSEDSQERGNYRKFNKFYRNKT